MDSLIVAHEWHAASAYTANYPCVRAAGDQLCVRSQWRHPSVKSGQMERSWNVWQAETCRFDFDCCSLSDGTLCDLHQETEQKDANVIISQSDVVLMDLTWCMMALILSVQHCNAVFITVPLQSFLQRYCPQFQLLLLLCFCNRC